MTTVTCHLYKTPKPNKQDTFPLQFYKICLQLIPLDICNSICYPHSVSTACQTCGHFCWELQAYFCLRAFHIAVNVQNIILPDLHMGMSFLFSCLLKRYFITEITGATYMSSSCLTSVWYFYSTNHETGPLLTMHHHPSNARVTSQDFVCLTYCLWNDEYSDRCPGKM